MARGNNSGIAPRKSCFRALIGDTRRPKGDGSFFHATIGGQKNVASDDESDDYYHHSSNKQLEREGSYRTKRRQKKFPLCNLRGLKLDKSHDTAVTVTSSHSQCVLLTSKNSQTNNEYNSSKKSVSSINGYRAPDMMWTHSEAAPTAEIEATEEDDFSSADFSADYYEGSTSSRRNPTTSSIGSGNYDNSDKQTSYSEIRNMNKITEQSKPRSLRSSSASARSIRSSSASARSGQYSHGELTVEEEEEFLDSLATFLTTDEKKQKSYQYQDLQRNIDQITGKTKEERKQQRDKEVPAFIGLEISAHNDDGTQTFVNDVDDTVSLGSSFQHLSTQPTKNSYDLSKHINKTSPVRNQDHRHGNNSDLSCNRQRPDAKLYRSGALLDSEISVGENSSSALSGVCENESVKCNLGQKSPQRDLASQKYDKVVRRRTKTSENTKKYFQQHKQDQSPKSARAKKMDQLDRLRNGNVDPDKENGFNGVSSKGRGQISRRRRVHEQDWKFQIDDNVPPRTPNSTAQNVENSPSLSHFKDSKYNGPSLLFPDEDDPFVEFSDEEEPEIALTLPGLEKKPHKMSSMRIESRTPKLPNARMSHHMSDGRVPPNFGTSRSEQAPSRQPVRAVPLKSADSMKARPTSPLPFNQFSQDSRSRNTDSLSRLKFTLA